MWIWPILLLVFGLLLSDVRCQLGQGTVTIVARSQGGLKCGADNACLKNSTCDEKGNCVCPGNYTGDGRFHCFNQSEHLHLQVVHNNFLPLGNAPNGGQAVSIYWPCRYRLTRIQTKGTGSLSKCDVQIFGMNKILNGRITLYGLQLFMELTYNNQDVVKLAIRKTGSAKMGIYRFTEWSKRISSHEKISKRQAPSVFDGSGSGAGSTLSRSGRFVDDDDEFLSQSPNEETWEQSRSIDEGQGQHTRFGIDTNSFAVLALSSCGLSVKFRPPSEEAVDVEVPGMSITVDKSHDPTFPDQESYLDGYLRSHGVLDTSSLHVIPEEEVFLSVLKNGAEQDDPIVQGAMCSDTVDTYNAFCGPGDDPHVKKCHKLLARPRLLKCMEKFKPMQLVNLCLRKACDKSDVACDLIYRGLQIAECLSQWSYISEALDCKHINPSKTKTKATSSSKMKRSKV